MESNHRMSGLQAEAFPLGYSTKELVVMRRVGLAGLAGRIGDNLLVNERASAIRNLGERLSHSDDRGDRG